MAIACQDDAELKRVAKALTQAGIENTGVKTDETLGKRYVAFKDPDRIALGKLCTGHDADALQMLEHQRGG